MSIESIHLSLVIPAFNEAARLPPYLASVQPYLEKHYGKHYEVIVVDDGSQDGLKEVLPRLGVHWPELRWIIHEKNRGKGAAVRSGMLAARGERMLFSDADGATPIDQEALLTAALRTGADLAVGSRLKPDHDRRCQRPWHRGLAGRLFAAVARGLFHLSVLDPQCGFKMFRAEAGHTLFSRLQESRYLFDLELLAQAERLGYKVAEVPIRWAEVPGGQFKLVREIPRTLWTLLRLRARLRS